MSEYPGQDYTGGQGYGDQGSGEQYGGGQYSTDQGGQSGGQGAEDEDVAIEYEYSTEESFQYSMDELTSAGYEPESDDSSSGYIA